MHIRDAEKLSRIIMRPDFAADIDIGAYIGETRGHHAAASWVSVFCRIVWSLPKPVSAGAD
jgi:hypothetical protein